MLRKKCQFSLSTATHPSPTYRCRRFSKLSTQCECTVTPIDCTIYVQPIAAQWCWGRGGKIMIRILAKKNLSTIYQNSSSYIYISRIANLSHILIKKNARHVRVAMYLEAVFEKSCICQQNGYWWIQTSAKFRSGNL